MKTKVQFKKHSENTKRITRIVWQSLVLSLVFLSCLKENPTSLDLLGRAELGEEKLLVLPQSQRDTTFQVEVSTGGSQNILLGSFREYDIGIIMKFENLPDTAQVESALLILNPHTIYGDTSAPSFSCSIHEITTTWEEDKVTWQDLQGGYDENPLTQVEIMPSISKADSIYLPSSLLQNWVDSPDENYGLLLQSSGATFIKEFYSSEASNHPRMRLIYTKEGVRDTLYWPRKDAIIRDAFLTHYYQLPPSQRLYIGSGLAHRCLLQFDFSDIPEKASINYAPLKFTVDSSNTVKKAGYTFGFRVYALRGPSWDPTTITLDSTVVIPKSTRGQDTVVVDISPLVQRWVSGQWENYGMLLLSTREDWDISRLAFYSSQSDSAYVPKVAVYYSLPPTKAF